MGVISFSAANFISITTLILAGWFTKTDYVEAVNPFKKGLNFTETIIENMEDKFRFHHHLFKPHKGWKKKKHPNDLDTNGDKNNAQEEVNPTTNETRFTFDINDKRFPSKFLFGVATASYQIEGAWNEDGKSENIWDHLCHHDASIVWNNENGDIACDSYHKYKEDVTLLKELGVNVYRFSISWSRILPDGFDNRINEKGVAYYRNLIKELRANNIEPMVTLYHWDLPQVLQDLGGWTNGIMQDAFVDYARVCFREFGKHVKFWLTFNEPKQVCNLGYGNGTLAPMVESRGIGEYLCSYHLVMAHSKVHHLYHDEFSAEQGGQIGMAIDSFWYEPASNSSEDIEASERKLQFTYGWFANPITHGDWPILMKEMIAERSRIQGYRKSRLPDFTREEIDYMKNTLDFFGLNHYTGYLVRSDNEPNKTELGWSAEAEAIIWQPAEWEGAASYWMKVVPWTSQKLLRWMKEEYDNPKIMITENGYSDRGTLNDQNRINYHQGYLSSIRDAMEEDGVDVIGYTAWSFMDNFEWMSGYSEKFGLYHVDFTSPSRTRTKKKSAYWYQNLIRTRCLAEECTD